MTEVRAGAIGRPLRRKEDRRLLTGQGRFTDDVQLPGQAYAVMVRSPHPHARIRGVGLARARAMPGVLGAYGGEDCRAAGLKPIPHEAVPSTHYDMKLTAPGGGKVFLGPHWLLAWDKARYVGEAVAMVVAETAAAALDAAEAVEVDYEPLPFALDARAALAEGAPAIWDEIRTMCRSTRASATRRRRRPPSRAPIMSCAWRSMSAASPLRRWSRARRWAPMTRRPAATRSMRALAARCGRSARSRRRSTSRPSGCASSPPMSAAISAPRTGLMSNMPWCCGRRGWRAGRSSSPRRARRRCSATARAAISSPGSSWRSAGTAASSRCAPTTSAISARAACRCRRSARARR